MAVIAYSWIPAEVITATKLNTISADLLELQDVAGFENAQFGSITISPGNSTNFADVTAMSVRALIVPLGNSVAGGATTARLEKTSATRVTATRGDTTGTTIVNFGVHDPRG